jgi:hypothetical protein
MIDEGFDADVGSFLEYCDNESSMSSSFSSFDSIKVTRRRLDAAKPPF